MASSVIVISFQTEADRDNGVNGKRIGEAETRDQLYELIGQQEPDFLWLDYIIDGKPGSVVDADAALPESAPAD